MDGLSPDAFRLAYGFTYVVMGLAVGVRAIAFPSSAFRNRLLALASFGLLHGAALWAVILLEGLGDAAPSYMRTLLYLPGSVALFYFAFGWNERRPMLAHSVAAAAICVFVAAALASNDVLVLQTVTRLGIDFPASVCAAFVFLRDEAFRGGSRYVERMRWIAATGFLIYAALQFFPLPADFFPASVLNSAVFESATGMSIRTARSLAILIAAVGTLSLLNHFDAVMREVAQTALAKAGANLKRALAITGLGIWEWDVAETHAIWSEQMYTIFGYEPDKAETSYRAFIERVHPEDRDGVAEAIRVTLETHAPYKMTHRIVATDGRIRVVEGRAEVEVGTDGKAHKMIGSLLDVTELEEARAELYERDVKLSRILQAAPEAIIIADHNGRIVLFNEGAQEIFGYTPAETAGQNIEMLMPERFRGDHHRHMLAFAHAPENQKKMAARGEIAGLRKNGEEFPARATISKLETPDGLTYTVWMRDVTQSKAIRQELLAAKTAAEAASAAKSNFIANMSHELRTPLNAILGFSEVMGMETFGPLGHARYREYVADIQTSGRHLLSVINDILNLSQLDAGKTELKDLEVVETVELLEDCARWVAPKAEEAGVALSVAAASELPSLWADRRFLRQIVLNLLSNAVKFTPKGGSVVIYAQEDEKGALRICVRDTGIGMSADQLARIGEPFLQFGQAMSRRFEGTGLGLSIAKRLAELHGGSLEVESAPGEGTTFTVSIPASRLIPVAPLQEPVAWG